MRQLASLDLLNSDGTGKVWAGFGIILEKRSAGHKPRGLIVHLTANNAKQRPPNSPFAILSEAWILSAVPITPGVTIGGLMKCIPNTFAEFLTFRYVYADLWSTTWQSRGPR